MNVEQVAVVGLAGRFPGAPTIAHFWQNLCNGVEARTRFSDEELAASVGPALLAYPGYVKSGFVLDNIEQFDADFFRFDAQQAQITDPQQRLFLECVWEAFEVAGIDITTYPGLVGVYAGASQSNYWAHARAGMMVGAGNVLAELIGNDKDYLATQTAYRLNLQGPCLSVQSACSTGLVAVHLACQSLLSHECDVAIAGGVTVHVPHRVGYPHVDGSVFSADGRCCAFSAQATGMVFGNGIGVVVLKRLSEALANGDHIWAVVRGSAVNNDGARKFGFMTSSRMGQIEVITEAWSVAEITAQELSYLETHGSGTPIGDVIEFSALATLFAGVDPSRKSCAIGAVKSNVGHLETAAGITGFIKTVLALHHRQLPPSINFATPNPDIDFSQTPLYLNTTLTPWLRKPELGQPTRCAGVSSFGIGGTNAHVVLEEAPVDDRRRTTDERRPTTDDRRPTKDDRRPTTDDQGQMANDKGQRTADEGAALTEILFEEIGEDGIVFEELPTEDRVALREEVIPEPTPHLLTLAAKNAPALRELAQRYTAFLAQADSRHFADICYTAQVGRSHFAQRLSVVATSAPEAHAKLTAFLNKPSDPPAAGIYTSAATTPPPVALCFGGAGRIGPDWGRTLYTTQPVFRQVIDQCHALAAPYLAPSLVAFILDETKPATNHEDPGLWPYRFAMEVGVAALWQSWGLTIAGVIGQGVGDYVAAYIAGVFSLADALSLVIAQSKRGQQSQQALQHIATQIAYAPPTLPLFIGGQVVTSEVATASYWLPPRPAPTATAWQKGQTALAAQSISYWLESHSDWPQLLETLAALYAAGVTIDWEAFAQNVPGQKPRKVLLPTYPFQRQRYWVDLPEQPLPQSPARPPQTAMASGDEPPSHAAAPSPIRQQLSAARGADQQALLMTYLQQLVAAVLAESTPAVAAPLTMPLTVGFAELGMTSLAAVTVRNRLQVDLGHKLPATLVLDYPTITTLAHYLTQTLLSQLVQAPDTVSTPAPSTLVLVRDPFNSDPIAQPAPPPNGSGKADSDIDALSADEIAEKLAAKLGMRI